MIFQPLVTFKYSILADAGAPLPVCRSVSKLPVPLDATLRNGVVPTDVKLVAKDIVAKLVQVPNAKSPRLKAAGNDTCLNEVEPVNAPAPIVVTLAKLDVKSTKLANVDPENAVAPIVVVAFRLRVVIAVHLAKALVPTLLTAGKVTVAKVVQFWKAELPTDVNVLF